MIEEDALHAALEARDPRFDGLFFVGVTSTGVYCRSICSARTPKRENRRFHASAAAAEKAGFRPCLMCRPELAPGLSPLEAGERLASHALARIEAGALEEQGLEALAQELGVSGRHLRRAMNRAFGASPVEIAQTCRLLAAKRLLRDTALPITQIAFAAGFRSVRRFNAVLKERYGLAPRALRGRGGAPRQGGRGGALALLLAARGAYDFDAMLDFLRPRLLAGVERIEDGTYARSVRIGGALGWIRIAPAQGGLVLHASESLAPALRPLTVAVRGAFDLDADIEAIDARLAPLGEPGRRIPGGLDGFEIAVRAVLGQQVRLRTACALAEALTTRFGDALPDGPEGLCRLFPTAERLATADVGDIAALGLPLQRAQALKDVAVAVAEGRLSLRRGGGESARAALAQVRGVGPWTIEYIALRALGDPDAFPEGDAVLRARLAPGEASAFRPWRGYAAIRVWQSALREARR